MSVETGQKGSNNMQDKYNIKHVTFNTKMSRRQVIGRSCIPRLRTVSGSDANFMWSKLVPAPWRLEPCGRRGKEGERKPGI